MGSPARSGKRFRTCEPRTQRSRAAAALVLFAATADFEELADGAVGNEPLHGGDGGVIAVAVGEGETDTRFVARGGHFIGLGKGAAVGLFHVDAARAGRGGGEDEIAVLIYMTRADGDDVGRGLGEHFAVVGEGEVELEPRFGFGEAGGISIGDGDEFGLGHPFPHAVDAVPVIAATGVTDDGDTPLFLRLHGGERGAESRREGGREELAARGVHGLIARRAQPGLWPGPPRRGGRSLRATGAT